MDSADFATQWLDFLGIELYNKGKRVLKYDGESPYTPSPLDTKLIVGAELGDVITETQPMSYPELTSFGYAIKLDRRFKLYKRTQGSYVIIKRTKNSGGLADSGYNTAKNKHNIIIEHDPNERRVRLKGDNVLPDYGLPKHSGVGPWVYYDPDVPKTKSKSGRKKKYRPMTREEMFKNLTGIKEEKKEEYLAIPEIPILLTDHKYIVCIQKQLTAQRIIVVGGSGMGKSLTVNAMASRIFYKWEERMGWLIDPLNQLYNLSKVQEHGPFNEMNSWINDMPHPIPALQLYLASRYTQNLNNPNISLIASLEFERFLKEYRFYIEGLDEFDVGKSIKYAEQYMHLIKNVKSADEIETVMNSVIKNSHKDSNANMIANHVNTFRNIFSEKITSNLWQDDLRETHRLLVKFRDGSTMEGHPFIMGMEARLVPVLNVSACRRAPFTRKYLADLMLQIIRHQMNKPEPKTRIWLIADELNEIYEKGKKNDSAAQAFEELFRQGRINNVGFIGNTQSLEKLNDEMIKNATQIVCVNIQDPDERRKIGKIFGLGKKPEVYEQLGNLDRGEIMIFTRKDEPFVIYDRWGRKKIETNRRWFRGRLFPPVNYHYVTGG